MKVERGAVLGSGRGAVRGTRGGSGSGTRSSIRRNETYLKIIPTHHNYRNGMVIRDQIKDKNPWVLKFSRKKKQKKKKIFFLKKKIVF